MKQFFLSISIIVVSYFAKAQTVLLSVDRADEQKTIDRGPNLKKFTHAYFRLALVAPKDESGAKIVYGSSANLAFGVRNKYKISGLYSLGFEIETQFTDFKLKQEKGKILPDTIINNTLGRLDYNALSLGFFNRFNFDPHRGNYLGWFLDVGAMGSWDFSIKYVTKNDQTNGTTVKTIVKHLPHVNNLDAKIYARIGLSHVSLFASYRLTELFKPSSHYPDLPAIVAGIDLAAF